MNHGELVADLAKTFDRTAFNVFIEPRLGPFQYGVPNPDLFVVKKSYNTDIRIYECKRTRSDLLADVNAGKWVKYREFADRVYFAVADGIEFMDVLQSLPVGITKRGPRGWRTVRAAPRNVDRKPIPEKTWLALIFSHLEYETAREKRLARMIAEREALCKVELGEAYRGTLHKISEAQAALQDAQYSAQHVQHAAIRQLKERLGLAERWGDDVLKLLILEPFQQIVADAFKKLTSAEEGNDEIIP